jgi:hypothetical protein
MVRLVNPIVGVLFDNRSQSLEGLEAPAGQADDILAHDGIASSLSESPCDYREVDPRDTLRPLSELGRVI